MMLKHVELDPQTSLFSQFADTPDEPVLLVIFFNVDHKDHEEFKSLGYRRILLYKY